MDTQNDNKRSDDQVENQPSRSKSETRPPVIKTKKKKSAKLVIVILVASAVLAAAAIYLLLQSERAMAPNIGTDNAATSQPADQARELKPAGIAYAFKEGQDNPFSLYYRPLDSGNREDARKFGSGDFIMYTDTHKDKVLVSTASTTNSNAGAELWYSDDGGKSYEKIFDAPTTGGETIGPQITDAVFSVDGSKVVIGYLPSDGQNIVKEIDPETKEVKDLFTSDSLGVFIEGYDQDKQLIFYSKGCYNCDGNTFSSLTRRNLADGSESVIYNEAGRIFVSTVMNKSLTKVLTVQGLQDDEFLGATGPFKVKEYDVSSKESTEIFETDSAVSNIGYRDSDDAPYYTKENSIFVVSGSEPSLAFEGDRPIREVYYVGKDIILASLGDFDDFTLTSYLLEKKEPTVILNGDSNTTIFGLTWR